jgi:transposase
MVGVEQWAEIRRMHKVEGLSIREIARRSGRDRNTVRAALRSSEPPRYRRAPRATKLDPFKEEIVRLLKEDPKLPGKRLRELIEEDGYAGGRSGLNAADIARQPPARVEEKELQAPNAPPPRGLGPEGHERRPELL